MQRWRPGSILLVVALAACASSDTSGTTRWASAQASLTAPDSVATVHFLASGGCYGSLGEIPHPIPDGEFNLAGTYTQLTGVYPGFVQYDAQYTGTRSGDHLTLSVNVAAISLVRGPYNLKAGDTQDWPACAYP